MSDRDEILSLERQFWTTMAAGEHEKSALLIAPTSAMVGAMGAQVFSPEKYAEMSANSPFRILHWQIRDEQVFFPTPDTAVCIYRVEETLEQDGKQMTSRSTDTTVWAKSDGSWKCILHTDHPAAG